MFRRLGLNTKNNEHGLASIVVVGVLIVLLTVISLGFARIMQRTAQNSLNDQTAAAATYAAQSGINDLATYIRANPTVKAVNCKDLIGTASSKGPFYNSSNLSGDRNSEYTCILLNQRPDSLYYQQIPVLESKVVKMTTDSTTGSVDKILISWQATDRTKKVPAPSSSTLPDVTTWNTANYVPMLRVTLYPVTTTGSVSSIQGASRTMFLSPRAGSSGASDTINYSAITEGGIQAVACSNDLDDPSDDPSFLADNDVTDFTDLANMDCNLAITGLANISNIDYFYIRALPIYSNADFELRAKDIDDRTVKFKGVQAVLDVTARVGPASKRLQARVDIGSNPANGTDPLVPSPNVGPDDTIPEHALRTANAACKRTLFRDDPYRYVMFEGNPDSCRVGATGPLDTPNAAITYFRINGIDDTTPNPAPYNGVSYIGAGGTANLTWRTEDATACMGSRGIGAWSGDKRPPVMNWTGSTGTGSQSISGITNVTYFDLRCNGPYSTTSTRTVTAWPPPRVDVTGPGSIIAGSNYTVNWSSDNAISCTKSGDWSGSVGTSGSQSFSHYWNDFTTRNYTVTCTDPSGRTSNDTYTLVVNRAAPPGGGEVTEPKPTCNGSVDVQAQADGRVSFRWAGSCPGAEPSAGNYCLYSWTDPGYAPINSCGVGSSGGPQYTAVRWGVEFCLGLRAYAGGWGLQLGGPGEEIYDCDTPYHPQVGIFWFDAYIWDQGPDQCSNTVNPPEYRNTWRCRNNANVVNESNGCPNGIHRYTGCSNSVAWWSQLSNGSESGINCRTKSSFGYFGFTYGGGLQMTGPWGWNGGSPYPFYVECKGPEPGPSGGINTARRCWNGGDCGYEQNVPLGW